MKTQFTLTGLALAAAFALAPAHAATFKWANDGDVRAMDPYTLDETVQNTFLGNFYEPLIRRTRTLGLEPGLAVKWAQTNPTTWRFTLRPGVKFSDGSPFTADDVVFSYTRIASKASVTSGNVASVKEARKIDALTVDFETRAPDPILPDQFTNFPIVSKAFFEKNNAVEVTPIGTGESIVHRQAMGTGPFLLSLREPDRKTVIVKNPGWWDKPEHNLDRVEFNVIGSAATRVAALLSGEMDMIYSVPLRTSTGSPKPPASS